MPDISKSRGLASEAVSRASRTPKDTRVWNLTPEDVAEQLKRSVWTVRRWMHDGKLDYWQLHPGGPMRTCQEAVNDFVHRHLTRAG